MIIVHQRQLPYREKKDPYTRRLDMLKIYLDRKIDSYPRKSESFEEFLKNCKEYTAGYNRICSKSHAKHFAASCYYCCGDMEVKTIDHFYPVGHPRHNEKLVVCCKMCNVKKANKNLNQLYVNLMTNHEYFGLPSKRKAKRVYHRMLMIHTGNPGIYFRADNDYPQKCEQLKKYHLFDSLVINYNFTT